MCSFDSGDESISGKFEKFCLWSKKFRINYSFRTSPANISPDMEKAILTTLAVPKLFGKVNDVLLRG